MRYFFYRYIILATSCFILTLFCACGSPYGLRIPDVSDSMLVAKNQQAPKAILFVTKSRYRESGTPVSNIESVISRQLKYSFLKNGIFSDVHIIQDDMNQPADSVQYFYDNGYRYRVICRVGSMYAKDSIRGIAYFPPASIIVFGGSLFGLPTIPLYVKVGLTYSVEIHGMDSERRIVKGGGRFQQIDTFGSSIWHDNSKRLSERSNALLAKIPANIDDFTKRLKSEFTIRLLRNADVNVTQ